MILQKEYDPLKYVATHYEKGYYPSVDELWRVLIQHMLDILQFVLETPWDLENLKSYVISSFHKFEHSVISEQVIVFVSKVALIFFERTSRKSVANELMTFLRDRFQKLKFETPAGKTLQEQLSKLMTIDEIMAVATADLGRSRGWYNGGHRFACPNGHLYVIGNCGGAMETSRCPDCGSVIGGSNHTLANGNTNVL